MARLRDYYVKDVAPALMKKFGYKSVMQIPKLDKIVVNVASGEAGSNSKMMDAILSDLSKITGQKPVITKAKKSIANFKLREGMNVGAKVTLRGERECMNFWIVSSMSRSRVSATSEESTRTHLTAAATIPWASKSS